MKNRRSVDWFVSFPIICIVPSNGIQMNHIPSDESPFNSDALSTQSPLPLEATPTPHRPVCPQANRLIVIS